ncbi:hypothetical protein [Hymenobacter canadensis]|uniref:N-acetyltransferase domain-containing protein n=1 Tax=Hymenobacter canadensis TaxID=2999067 RepID=A0ABY7LRV9_9BACT|nr:hypothetical protein [Hymenobacter canadensis]WBA41950.1 hypothetical protein O3303_19345 [Hymenobacter canadensis]
MEHTAAIDAELVGQRAAILLRHSPYHFLRELSADVQQERFGTGRAVRFGQKPAEEVFSIQSVQFLYEQLAWDSAFFGAPVFRLFSVLFGSATTLLELTRAVQAFQAELAQRGQGYCFVEVPPEDIRLLQALTQASWRWNETRLHYYRANLATYAEPRYPVRTALPMEAAHIGQVAAAARNDHDRFHADPWFGDEQADAFLARYATSATEGYCDAVLVPAVEGVPIDSFLAISDLAEDAALLGVGLSRVVLTAVGPANRGWHLRLVSEIVHRAREQNAQFVLMTTQATNGAVVRNAEKLGFSLGSVSHILSCPLPAEY